MQQLFNKLNYPGSKYAYYQRKIEKENSLPVVRFDKQAFFKKAKKYQDICFGIVAVYFCALLLYGEIKKHFFHPLPTKKENAVIVKKTFVTKKLKYRIRFKK